MYFFWSYFHNPPLADINLASYEPFAYNSEGVLQYTCDKVTVRFPHKCHEEIESHLNTAKG